MSIAPWFPDWLRERMRQAASVLRTDALTWSEIVNEYSNDGAGLLYVLITVAHGRRTFDADPRDVLALLAMDRSRFNQLVAEFIQRGLIVASTSGDTTIWTILR
jgi:hypothetical protein